MLAKYKMSGLLTNFKLFNSDPTLSYLRVSNNSLCPSPYLSILNEYAVFIFTKDAVGKEGSSLSLGCLHLWQGTVGHGSSSPGTHPYHSVSSSSDRAEK